MILCGLVAEMVYLTNIKQIICQGLFVISKIFLLQTFLSNPFISRVFSEKF